jgi:hypothetical protein
MMLILSGEGKTDMGCHGPTEMGNQFHIGPMGKIVDRLIEARMGYSLYETHQSGAECVQFVPETELAKHAKLGPTRFPGIKYGKGTAFFTRNAQVIGLLAKQIAKKKQDSIIAVLLRDADLAQSDSPKAWQEKFDSMVRGFKLAEFESGVPMVPKPKSEAWLLCGLKAVTHCDSLEDASGNDDSPRSLKAQLKKYCGHEPPAEEQLSWIVSGRINIDDINMPSFMKFREALDDAIERISKATIP